MIFDLNSPSSLVPNGDQILNHYNRGRWPI